MAGVMSRALRRPDRQQPRAAAAGARARGRVRYLGHRQGPAWPSRAGHYLTDPSKEPDRRPPAYQLSAADRFWAGRGTWPAHWGQPHAEPLWVAGVRPNVTICGAP